MMRPLNSRAVLEKDLESHSHSLFLNSPTISSSNSDDQSRLHGRRSLNTSPIKPVHIIILLSFFLGYREWIHYNTSTALAPLGRLKMPIESILSFESSVLTAVTAHPLLSKAIPVDQLESWQNKLVLVDDVGYRRRNPLKPDEVLRIGDILSTHELSENSMN